MERPTSVTVFGILNIVFAAFGVIGIVMTFYMFGPDAPTTNNPVVRLIHENQTYATWMKISLWLGAAGCVALLASGIGLLNLQSWARKLAVGYSIYSLISCVVGTIFNCVYLLPPLLDEAHQKSGPESAAALGGAIGGVVGGCIGAVYPVLLLIFMCRKNVVAAFQRPPV